MLKEDYSRFRKVSEKLNMICVDELRNSLIHRAGIDDDHAFDS